MKLIINKKASIIRLILSAVFLSSCNTASNTVSTPPKPSPLMVSRIKMFNSQNGWGILNFGSSWIVVKTSNGGSTWKIVTPPGATTKGGISGDFINPKNAWIVFNTFENLHFSSFATTNDSGKNWKPISFSRPLIASAYNIFFQTPTMGWALEKSNSGQQLIQIQLNAPQSKIRVNRTIPTVSFKASLRGIRFSSSKIGWVSTESKYPELIKTTNSGGSWFLQKLPKAYSYKKSSCVTSLPQFSNTTDAVVASSCTAKGITSTQFYTTTNAGSSWIESSRLFAKTSQPVFSSFGTYIWAIGQAKNKASSNSIIAVSATYGHNWQFYNLPFDANYTQSINFFNTSIGLVLEKTNNNTTLWKTKNGGLSWTRASFNLK